MSPPATIAPNPSGTTTAAIAASPGDTPSVLARFWSKVDKSAGANGCWLWTASTNGHGYGKFKFNGRCVSAHRFSYELATGESLGDRYLDHKCHTPGCVNPRHLRPVTNKQNLENRSGTVGLSGVRGVSWRDNRWEACVGHNGKRIYVGRFTTLEDAAAAAKAKRMELFTHNDLDRRDR